MSGRKAGSTFSFCKREQKPVLSDRAAVSILSRSPLKLLQVPPTTYSFPEFSYAFGCLPQTRQGQDIGNLGRGKHSGLGFSVFCVLFFNRSWGR